MYKCFQPSLEVFENYIDFSLSSAASTAVANEQVGGRVTTAADIEVIISIL